ncbi:hypothetical protein DM860_007093 [Cuscuta australis]|uniref:Uncharacterized protein n=1 Tax=Cuscuta australis TaxID=267555 RepID=A0A328EA83_9ASTE|nr:hypothetical protein DM860_007093 [Cuscuta australis]
MSDGDSIDSRAFTEHKTSSSDRLTGIVLIGVIAAIVFWFVCYLVLYHRRTRCETVVAATTRQVSLALVAGLLSCTFDPVAGDVTDNCVVCLEEFELGQDENLELIFIHFIEEGYIKVGSVVDFLCVKI